ncbi:MAG: tetratricopeptide repeat protein [Pseudomonadota bacterium]
MVGLGIAPASASTFDFEELLKRERPSGVAPDLPGADSLTPAQIEQFNQAVAAFSRGSFAQANSVAREISATAPAAPEPWYLLGLIRANLGEYDAAIDALDRSAALYGNNADPLVIKGDILVRLGRVDEARLAYETATERDPSAWLAQESLGILLEERGDVAGAGSRYALAAAQAPSGVLSPRLRLAAILVAENNPDAAVATVAAYAKANPESVEALAALGQLQIRADTPEDAAETFSEAIEKAPGEPQLYLWNARAHVAAGDFDSAVHTLTAAHEAFPRDADVSLELGNLHGARQNYKKAIEVATDGLAVNPGDPRLLKSASLAHFRLGDVEAARTYAFEITKKTTHTASDLVWLGMLDEARGAEAAAVAAYEAALKMNADNWVAANNLAMLLSRTDPDRAVALAAVAVNAAPEPSAIDSTLGWTHYKAGNLEEAGSAFARLIARGDGTARHHFHYGLVLIELGDDDEGRAQVLTSLALDPYFEFADEARALLSE